MPKASFASKDAVDVSLGIQEGPVEVVGAVCRVHQYPPAKGSSEQSDPFPCIQLKLAKLNEAGERLDDEPVPMEFSVGALERYHPGFANDANDTDPEDQGTEVDTEGNTIFSVESTYQMSKKCKWIIFTTSLEEKGFKPDVLAGGYLPDLIGLKFVAKTVAGNKIPGQTYKRDPTQLVCDKIIQFPYDKKAKGKAAEAKAAPKAAAVTPAQKVNGATQAEDSPEPLALSTLTEIAGEMKGKQGVERRKLQTQFQARLMKNKVPVKLHKPAIELVKSDEWLNAISLEREDSPLYGAFMVDGETVNFAD